MARTRSKRTIESTGPRAGEGTWRAETEAARGAGGSESGEDGKTPHEVRKRLEIAKFESAMLDPKRSARLLKTGGLTLNPRDRHDRLEGVMLDPKRSARRDLL